jgi:hypothetical protein
MISEKQLSEMVQFLLPPEPADIIEEIVDSGAPELMGLTKTEYRAKLMTLNDPEALLTLHKVTQSATWQKLQERRAKSPRATAPLDTPIPITHDKTSFQRGQRVCRPQDVFDTDSPLLTGAVADVYEMWMYTCLQEERPFCPPVHYPELYRVEWDNGTIGHGYLPHGIQALGADHG